MFLIINKFLVLLRTHKFYKFYRQATNIIMPANINSIVRTKQQHPKYSKPLCQQQSNMQHFMLEPLALTGLGKTTKYVEQAIV